MNRNIFIILLLAPLIVRATRLEPSYLFAIIFPSTYSSKPRIEARWKGKFLNIENGSCLLSNGIVDDIFYIIITEEVVPHVQKNRAPRLKRVVGRQSKCYQIIRNSTAAFNKEQSPWLFREKPLEEQEEILPENALVILLDPVHVQGLKIIADKNNSIKSLPALIISSESSQEQLQESINNSVLAAVNTNMLHSRVASSKQWSGNCLLEIKV